MCSAQGKMRMQSPLFKTRKKAASFLPQSPFYLSQGFHLPFNVALPRHGDTPQAGQTLPGAWALSCDSHQTPALPARTPGPNGSGVGRWSWGRLRGEAGRVQAQESGSRQLRTHPGEAGRGRGRPVQAEAPGPCACSTAHGASLITKNSKVKSLRIVRWCWRALNPKHRVPFLCGAPRKCPGHVPRSWSCTDLRKIMLRRNCRTVTLSMPFVHLLSFL